MGASRVFKKRGGVECKWLQGEASWCPISHQVQKLLKYRSNLYHCQHCSSKEPQIALVANHTESWSALISFISDSIDRSHIN